MPDNAPPVFYFEGAAIRAVTWGGAPWFVLLDVCKAVGIVNSHTVAARLDDDKARRFCQHSCQT